MSMETPAFWRPEALATPDHEPPASALQVAGFALWLHASGAAYLPALRTWLVADAHVGKALSFRQLGVPVPRGTTADTLDRLSALVAAQATEHIIFLGDFLHSARAHAPETQAALAAWRAHHAGLRLTLVRGNHDDHAGDPPLALQMQVVNEPLLLEGSAGRLALCHYPEPVPGAYVLAGHWHPCVSISGAGRDRLRLPCFWFGPDAAEAGLAAYAVGVLPAFGGFTGMHPIERRAGDRVFAVAGPVIRELPAARPSTRQRAGAKR